MKTIFETVLEFLSDQGWPHKKGQNEPDVAFAFQGENGKWMVYIRAHEELSLLTIYSMGLNDVPENKRTEMALLFTRNNLGMILGNFELDLETGEYRFKNTLDFRASPVSKKAVKLAVYTNVAEMDKYLTSISEIINA